MQVNYLNLSAICLFHHVTAALLVVGLLLSSMYTWHPAANVSSVTFTADVRIRKLKSDLFLQAVIPEGYL